MRNLRFVLLLILLILTLSVNFSYPLGGIDSWRVQYLLFVVLLGLSPLLIIIGLALFFRYTKKYGHNILRLVLILLPSYVVSIFIFLIFKYFLNYPFLNVSSLMWLISLLLYLGFLLVLIILILSPWVITISFIKLANSKIEQNKKELYLNKILEISFRFSISVVIIIWLLILFVLLQMPII